jgi:DNA-binding NtrC family response regulator
VAALEAARGGSLCVPRTGLPHDFPSMVAAVRDPAASVQLIVCGPVNHAEHPYLILPVPIQVPSIAARAADLSRIVDEYAHDAIATLGAFQRDYTDADRTWISDRYANTWGEIEMTTMRLIAVRSAPSVEEAARRLGIKYPTLRRWLHNHRVNSRGEVRP